MPFEKLRKQKVREQKVGRVLMYKLKMLVSVSGCEVAVDLVRGCKKAKCLQAAGCHLGRVTRVGMLRAGSAYVYVCKTRQV